MSSLPIPREWASHSAECLVFKDTYFSYNIAPGCKPARHFIWCSVEERAICSQIGANAVCVGYAESSYYDLHSCLWRGVDGWFLTICGVCFGSWLEFPVPISTTDNVLFAFFSDFNQAPCTLMVAGNIGTSTQTVLLGEYMPGYWTTPIILCTHKTKLVGVF